MNLRTESTSFTCFIGMVIGLVAVFAACTHPVRKLVFQPHKIKHVPSFPENLPDLERIWLTTDQGKVEGWLFQGRSLNTQNSGPAVLIAHGNRELIDDCLERAMFYRDMGFCVLIGEYRGYGRSAGKPSRERIRADYIRFFDLLAAQPRVDPERVVFHGRSLGGAVLADLQQYRRPAAVILESTFSSIKAMAHGAPDFLLSDNYNTLSAMAAYDGPVLILHGTQDRVVPVRHARMLKNHIPHARLVLDHFRHSDALETWPGYWGSIRQFIVESGLIK